MGRVPPPPDDGVHRQDDDVHHQDDDLAGLDEETRIYPYLRRSAETYLLKPTRDGELEIRLANFAAIVTEERQYDDGVDIDHRSLIRVSRPNGEGEPAELELEIPTAQFAAMNWVTNRLGHRYIVNAGNSNKDHLRAAIQTFSHGVQTRRIFAHTGWRQLGSRWAYLHAGGALTAEGLDAGVEIDLPDNLAHYRLPPPPAGAELVEAVRASLRQMDLVDDGVGAVQLARVYAPPLGGWYRLDVGVFVLGRTGSGKTELSALAQAHYGAGFTARSLPGNWESTENALLLKAFRAKEALFEVDDYNPSGNPSDHAAMSRKADRLFRGQANGSGRDRLTPDIRLRTTHYPRGLVSSSGEDLPVGRSLRARMWLVELAPKAMDLAVLSQCQAYARSGVFAAAMAGYLQWLAARVDQIKADLPARYDALRKSAPESLREHNRIPANYAALMIGIETFLAFAVDVAAVTAAEGERLLSRCGEGLRQQGTMQMDVQHQSEDAVRFIEMLRSGLSTGRVFVADGDEREATRPPPMRQSQLGWRGSKHRHQELEGETREEIRWETRGERIGYVVNGELWLDPEAAYTAVAKIAREQGAGALRTKIRLGKALVERGYIQPGGDQIAYRHGREWLTPSRVWRIPQMRVLGDGPEDAECAPF